MIFSFDDNCLSQYEKAKPIFDKYNIRGTLFLNGSDINTAGSLKIWHVELFIDKGWEIANHGFSHKRLTDLTDDEIKKEIELNLHYFSKFKVELKGFAYPWGVYDDRVIEIVMQYHDYARATVGTRPTVCENYSISAMPLSCKTTLEDAKNNKHNWFFGHVIGEETNTHTWSAEDLEKLIVYLRENNIPIERGQDVY